MAKIATNLTELIGNTPLLAAGNYGKTKGLAARLLVKLLKVLPSCPSVQESGHSGHSPADDGPGTLAGY